MEAAAPTGCAAATRGGGSYLPMAVSRKEWRVVSDYHPDHSVRNAGDEEMDLSKMGQSDERTMYEVQHGRESVDADFCLINVDGSLDDDIVQQRIHDIAGQRQELLLMEIELRAQMIARAEIMEMQNSFDAQMKDHAEAVGKLQEQLCEKEQAIDDLERRMEEKEQELHSIKLDHEAAWAKEDLLREQNKELATYRRERDHSEAERGQYIQQIQDLQEHLQEKERHILELQEQHRTAQETIFLKDEQLKAWYSRAQEVDALQSTTNHSLQSELRERTEQYNQLWIVCQTQFAEMERFHLHAIQQLQLELADAREMSGSYFEESRVPPMNKKDVPKFSYSNGHPQEINGTNASSVKNGAISNIMADDSSFKSDDNASCQANHVATVPITPSLIGMPTYLPPGQMTAMHPFILHQQGMSHSSQSHVGNYQSVPISSLPQWHCKQGSSEDAQFSIQTHLEASQTDGNMNRTDGKYEYEISGNSHAFNADYTNVHLSHEPEPDPVAASSTDQQEGLESVDQSSLAANSVDQEIGQVSSQFVASLNLNSLQKNSETKEQNLLNLSNVGVDNQRLAEEEMSTASALSEISIHSANLKETSIDNGVVMVVTESFAKTGQYNKATVTKSPEISLLDERALLACIARTIPAGGRIRINSTLPNRLGKMLAPLHWHDYKKYGKLDDFVAGHPELFLIDGDYIQLREGAQAKIAATTAVAKVAAAAAASAPYSSFLPSVAVTPMAQSYRANKVLAVDSGNPNGLSFGSTRGTSNEKILSKSKESLNGRTTGGALIYRR